MATLFLWRRPKTFEEQNEYSKTISSGKEFPIKKKVAANFLEHSFGAFFRKGVAIHAYLI